MSSSWRLEFKVAPRHSENLCTTGVSYSVIYLLDTINIYKLFLLIDKCSCFKNQQEARKCEVLKNKANCKYFSQESG